ncbi:MAG: hypothetical protein U9O78_02805 [Patescibacteria group bacterium]|nr:hypothetical protein [Patescibacteria group bacterium]
MKKEHTLSQPTLSQQIIDKSKKSENPLERELAAAMESPDPLVAITKVVGNLEKNDDSTIGQYCQEVSEGVHDQSIADHFLSYRPYARTEDYAEQLKEPNTRCFISAIESFFQEQHPDIKLNTYLGCPDPRVANNVSFKTLKRLYAKIAKTVASK